MDHLLTTMVATISFIIDYNEKEWRSAMIRLVIIKKKNFSFFVNKRAMPLNARLTVFVKQYNYNGKF